MPTSSLRLARASARDAPRSRTLTWLDALRRKRASYASPLADADTASGWGSMKTGCCGPQARSREPEWAFIAARDMRQPVYSRPFNDAMRQRGVPGSTCRCSTRSAFAGALIAEYSIDQLLRYFVPAEVTRRHAITRARRKGHALASTVIALPGRATRRHRSCTTCRSRPRPTAWCCAGRAIAPRSALIGNTLFWMVVALSGLTLWMLLGTWRHMRRRVQMQSALVQETNFRRAMENSMLTGMRAMDIEGRITYVNPAFCAMTGFSEAELIGRMPPFPYWPTDRLEENIAPAAAGAAGPQPGRRHRGQGHAQGRLAVRRPHVRVAADRRARQADRLDDLDDQHHRGQAHPRPALGLARALHHRARGAGRRGLGAVGAARRAAVRQPLVPAVVRRRCARPRPAGQRQPCRAAGLPGRRRRSHRQPVGPADAGAHRRPVPTRARSMSKPEQVVRRALALPAVDRRPAGADADRHRHHGAPARRRAGGAPGREGAGHEPAGHDGRDGVVRWRTS